ncbi:RTA1 like protein-domain-containing protein [Lineolata rhizophorae]|uniref:RTA1 like protein-domain-containing protein n=1 Tax=Lineolata rhizophorae TaxID=578093 RepID=A0A6A6NTL9_9PEZI|nr:RTA1 like protein-domain-containing protein [Lineolata rhizophorae]
MECTVDTCPIEESIYGYRPSIPANAFFLAAFAISFIAHIVQGVRYKTWSFMVGMTIGCICEIGGEVGRLILHDDPFDDIGFNLQICLLTIAPAFFAAGVYLCLKHLVLTFGADISRIPAAWYTYIFITCDFISLVLQGAGGGTAATADDGDRDQVDLGNNLMMAGLSFQVFTLVIFAVLSFEYFTRVRKHRHELNTKTTELRRSSKFRFFIVCLAISYTAILLRCIYRIIEMAGGWGNEIMQHEVTFMILDPTMILIASSVFNFFHPGRCFKNRRTEKLGSTSECELESQVTADPKATPDSASLLRQ